MFSLSDYVNKLFIDEKSNEKIEHDIIAQTATKFDENAQIVEIAENNESDMDVSDDNTQIENPASLKNANSAAVFANATYATNMDAEIERYRKENAAYTDAFFSEVHENTKYDADDESVENAYIFETK